MPSVHISTLPVFIGSVVRSTCGHYNDTCIYIWCTCMYVYIVVYIYNYIEREKERDNRNNSRWKQLSCGCGYNWLKKNTRCRKTRAVHNNQSHAQQEQNTAYWKTNENQVGHKRRIMRAQATQSGRQVQNQAGLEQPEWEISGRQYKSCGPEPPGWGTRAHC